VLSSILEPALAAFSSRLDPALCALHLGPKPAPAALSSDLEPAAARAEAGEAARPDILVFALIVATRRRNRDAATFPRIFLLSPANSGGERAALLLRPQASFPLAVQLRSPVGASLADVFTFSSGLYFRGKRAYAERFAAPPRGVPPACVITPGFGLVPLDTRVRPEDLLEFARIPIDVRDRRYRLPLERDARALLPYLGRSGRVVLLGSVASAKYTQILLEVFGTRLLFPPSFVGRGDMSRGGLLLRCAAAGVELEYAPVQGAVVRGPRPPKLPRLPRRSEPAPPPDLRTGSPAGDSRLPRKRSIKGGARRSNAPGSPTSPPPGRSGRLTDGRS
jgi:hypothetical protein